MMAELFARGDRPLPRQGRLDARRRPGHRHPRRQRDRRRRPAARGRRRRCRASCLGQGRVAVAFFGEGAVNQGAFHEAVNLAAIWDLPVLFVCENNVYAEFTDSRDDDPRAVASPSAPPPTGSRPSASTATTSTPSTRSRADAAARCRAGDGPFLIEAETYRWHGHYEGDAQPYKPEDEASAWRERDPLEVSRRAPRRARRGRRPRQLDADPRRGRRRASRPRSSAPAPLPAPDPEEAYARCLRAELGSRRAPLHRRPQRGHGDGDRRGRAGRPDRHRRRRRRRHLPRHQGPARALRPGAGDRRADQRDGLRRRRGRRRDDRAAADRRDHVHGLRRRLPGPDPQPGREAAAT